MTTSVPVLTSSNTIFIVHREYVKHFKSSLIISVTLYILLPQDNIALFLLPSYVFVLLNVFFKILNLVMDPTPGNIHVYCTRIAVMSVIHCVTDYIRMW
jgi:hypothetical protein